MKRSAREAKADADRAWQEIVWPSMRAIGWWGANPSCWDFDKQSDSAAKALDVLGAIDKLIQPNGYAFTYSLRVHFVTGYRHPGIGNTLPWLTVRYRTKVGRPTEFDKLEGGAAKVFQAYVSAERRTVTLAMDTSAMAVLNAIKTRPLDLQDVEGGNQMARCWLAWLLDDGADLRVYSSRDEAHRVNAPTVDNLIAHYGDHGRADYEPHDSANLIGIAFRGSRA